MDAVAESGRNNPVSKHQIQPESRELMGCHFLSSADHEKNWQPYPVNPFSVYNNRAIRPCHANQSIKNTKLLVPMCVCVCVRVLFCLVSRVVFSRTLWFVFFIRFTVS